MNHCHLNDWRKFSHMPHFTADRPLWSALIVCFTALTLNALREKTTLECLILHSICTSFFIHSVSFTKVQATRCDNQYNFSWPRKLVDTFGFIGRFWAETLWEPHFFFKSEKKVVKVGILHFMDMFLLPEHHASVDQQLYAFLFIYCIVKSAEKWKIWKRCYLWGQSWEEAEFHPLGCTGTWDLILRPVEHQAHGQLRKLLSINGPRCGGVLCWNLPFPKPFSNDSICQIISSNGTMLSV